MKKRYYLLGYLLAPVLAVAPSACGCVADSQCVDRPVMPIALIYLWGDTVGWGITDRAVDSIHGFELNLERDLDGYFGTRHSMPWETTDTEHGLLELAEDGLEGPKVPGLTWWGLVAKDICTRTRRIDYRTGLMHVRVFRYYDLNGNFWGGEDAIPYEGRWIGDASDPLDADPNNFEPYDPITWPVNCDGRVR